MTNSKENLDSSFETRTSTCCMTLLGADPENSETGSLVTVAMTTYQERASGEMLGTVFIPCCTEYN